MILIHCEAKKLRNGNINPKKYPYWEELISLISNKEIVQIGVEGDAQYTNDFRKNLSFKELIDLCYECETWIAIDSFFQHLAWRENKRGIVLFGPSDPKLFGHSSNINLCNPNHFRLDQFNTWEECKYSNENWVSPEEIITHLNRIINLI